MRCEQKRVLNERHSFRRAVDIYAQRGFLAAEVRFFRDLSVNMNHQKGVPQGLNRLRKYALYEVHG
jgi:hypothetical protein